LLVEEINAAIETLSVLGVDGGTSQIHAEVKHALFKAGYTLPENDIRAAATSRQMVCPWQPAMPITGTLRAAM
jgi:predicted nucleic acid-binding protein